MEQLAEDFWNIRGDFHIARVINVGTHMSLARRPNGRFVLLDSYEAGQADRDALMTLTDGGKAIDAVLNLHPFHTLHCGFIQGLLPHVRLIGTRRHHEQCPDLNWDPALIEKAETQREFADAFDFSMPAGVDFVSDDPAVHVGSVLARHRTGRIVHADDTFNILDLPWPIDKLMSGPTIRFHPKLAAGLEKRAGAADDYVRWATDLGHDWANTQIVATAHNSIARMADQGFATAIAQALAAASDTIDDHRRKYG
ncbi:MAG: hypothetical protein OSB00_04295 [Sphingomonas bacterium]|nr:hypothetical protein [Sphingomonas bacterium]